MKPTGIPSVFGEGAMGAIPPTGIIRADVKAVTDCDLKPVPFPTDWPRTRRQTAEEWERGAARKRALEQLIEESADIL